MVASWPRVPGPTAQARRGERWSTEPRAVMSDASITSVQVMTIQAQLPAPVIFGEWIMRQREFALVRVRTDQGVDGLMYTLTRDGAVADQIRKTIAALYVGTAIDDRERT